MKFYGDVSFPTIQKAIPKAHLDVMASQNYDTFGMTLIEAEAYGVPVFFCDPDMKEVVPAGGYLLSKGPEPAEMATTLVDLLAHPEKIAKMSSVMVQHRDEVLISRRIEKLLDIFKEIP